MNSRTPVFYVAGATDEALAQLARHLGRDKVRRQVFEAIYGRKRNPRTAKQIMTSAKIEEKKRIRVLKSLDHLSQHSLIEKIENDGSAKDGSRFMYRKSEFIRANKKRILDLADGTYAATTASPNIQDVHSAPSRRKSNRKTPQKVRRLVVLYLTASPDPNEALRVDAEVRKVQQAIRSSIHRDKIVIEYRPAADIRSILDGLNDLRPRIVHFSGHSNASGLAMDNISVTVPGYVDLPFALLGQALHATDDPPDVVVLNSCESSAAKDEILKSSKVLVSMRSVISDAAAVAFACQFYAAIASKQPVEKAFYQGKLAISGISEIESNIPELHCTAATDTKTLKLM